MLTVFVSLRKELRFFMITILSMLVRARRGGKSLSGFYRCIQKVARLLIELLFRIYKMLFWNYLASLSRIFL